MRHAFCAWIVWRIADCPIAATQELGVASELIQEAMAVVASTHDDVLNIGSA